MPSSSSLQPNILCNVACPTIGSYTTSFPTIGIHRMCHTSSNVIVASLIGRWNELVFECHLSVSFISNLLLLLISGIKVMWYNPKLAKTSLSPSIIPWHRIRLGGLCTRFLSRAKSSYTVMHLTVNYMWFFVMFTRPTLSLTYVWPILTRFDQFHL